MIAGGAQHTVRGPPSHRLRSKGPLEMPQSVRCQESLDGIPGQDRQIKGAFSQGLVAFLTIDEVDHIEKPSPDAFLPSSSAAIGDQWREEIRAVILADGTGQRL